MRALAAICWLAALAGRSAVPCMDHLLSGLEGQLGSVTHVTASPVRIG